MKLIQYKEYWLIGLAGAVGLVLLVYGTWQAVAPEEAAVEIEEKTAEAAVQNRRVFVDVAGAVKNPGVFELQEGSRVGDAIVAAGGWAETADRGWVEKNLNLAQTVKDGAKVYIPAITSPAQGEIEDKSNRSNTTNSSKVNINTAGASELDKLWGIGEARAQAIIAARPYAENGELVSKAGIPQNVYDRIKDEVTVY